MLTGSCSCPGGVITTEGRKEPQGIWALFKCLLERQLPGAGGRRRSNTNAHKIKEKKVIERSRVQTDAVFQMLTIFKKVSKL